MRGGQRTFLRFSEEYVRRNNGRLLQYNQKHLLHLLYLLYSGYLRGGKEYPYTVIRRFRSSYWSADSRVSENEPERKRKVMTQNPEFSDMEGGTGEDI